MLKEGKLQPPFPVLENVFLCPGGLRTWPPSSSGASQVQSARGRWPGGSDLGSSPASAVTSCERPGELLNFSEPRFSMAPGGRMTSFGWGAEEI